MYRLINEPVEMAPKSLAPFFLKDRPRFLDIHPTEMARQLTLLSEKLMKGVSCKELSDVVHANGEVRGWKCPNLEQFVNRYDSVVRWVASEIVSSINTSLRIEVVHRFVDVMDVCFKIRNFSDAYAILAGMKHAAVDRLKFTWKNIAKKPQKTLQQLKTTLLNSTKMLKLMNDSPTPMIPVIDLYIAELTANVCPLLDTVERQDFAGTLINFKKLRAQAAVFEQVQKSINGVKYGYVRVDQYASYLENERVVMGDLELMECSKDCEPEQREVF